MSLVVHAYVGNNITTLERLALDHAESVEWKHLEAFGQNELTRLDARGTVFAVHKQDAVAAFDENLADVAQVLQWKLCYG